MTHLLINKGDSEDNTWHNQLMPTNFNLPLNLSWDLLCDHVVRASCYLHECHRHKKDKKTCHEKVFHEKTYPAALPQMLSTSVLACKQPLSADGSVEAGQRESTQWHDEGSNSKRARELDALVLLKCTMNT